MFAKKWKKNDFLSMTTARARKKIVNCFFFNLFEAKPSNDFVRFVEEVFTRVEP